MRKVWDLDNQFNDSGEWNPGDQFTSWLRVSVTDKWGIANAGGIRTLAAGNNGQRSPSGNYACVVLVSNLIKSQWDNPWKDQLVDNESRLEYWGDAKSSKNKKAENWPGNKALISVNDYFILKKAKKVPPFLYFQRKKKGEVTFKGLFGMQDLRKEFFHDINHNEDILNYRGYFNKIENCVDSSWIIQRALKGVDDSQLTPIGWLEYQKSITL